MSNQKPIKVFVSLVTPFLYGMERAVIEIFEEVQPLVEPHFLMTYTTYRLNLPVLDAVKKAGISYSFLSDKTDWPTLHKPHSISEGLAILKAIVLGNRDTLRASQGKDVFYMSSLRTPYSAFLTIVSYWLCGKPVVYGFHDTLNKPSHLLKFFGPLISHYVFHSAYTRAQFEINNPWAAARNSPVIPLVIKYVPSPASSPLPSNSRVILFIGQIAKYKGADLLIEAFLQIKDFYPDAALHFVGNPHEEFKTEFLTAINVPEVEGRIVHWGYREDVHDFLKSTYILVQPSRPSLVNESFGRGVVEAMAAGVPSVCFRSGALPEHVIHQETGLICDEESANCLTQQLRILLDNPSLRNTYAHQARTRYENHYALEKLKERWIAFFESLGKRD